VLQNDPEFDVGEPLEKHSKSPHGQSLRCAHRRTQRPMLSPALRRQVAPGSQGLHDCVFAVSDQSPSHACPSRAGAAHAPANPANSGEVSGQVVARQYVP
jgi:hypothetical protein